MFPNMQNAKQLTGETAKHTRFLPQKLFIALAFLGALQEIDLVWNMADTHNALMALPNLLAVVILAPVVAKLSKQFFADPEKVYTPADYADIIKRR